MLDSVTSPPTIRTHQNRMLPGKETDCYQLILTNRAIPFTYVMYAAAPDDTEVGNRPPSVRPNPPGDHDGETESHRTEFGAGFGDQFAYAMYAPVPEDIGDGDRSPSVIPDLLGDPGGNTDSHRIAPDWIARVTSVDFDNCSDGTFPSDPSSVDTGGMTYQEKIEILSGTMYDYDDYCDNLPDYFDYDEPYDWEELHGFDGPVEYGMCSEPCLW